MKKLVFKIVILGVCFSPIGSPIARATPPENRGPAGEAAKNGGLLVFPKRVVLSGRERGSEITLMNRGARATTFRLELIDLRMDGQGRLVPAGDGEAVRSLKGMVRFSPRQVRVEPDERQMVRVVVRKPPNLAPGEYRSHLQLRALPSTDHGPRIDDFQEEQGNTLSLQITALPAISLPVIVRHGDLGASVGLEVLDLLDRGPGSKALALRLDREGDRSVYGDITAHWLPTGGGEEVLVGRARGVAIYTSVDQRTFDLALRRRADLSWDSGTLRIAFESRPELDGGGTGLSANYEISLP